MRKKNKPTVTRLFLDTLLKVERSNHMLIDMTTGAWLKKGTAYSKPVYCGDHSCSSCALWNDKRGCALVAFGQMLEDKCKVIELEDQL